MYISHLYIYVYITSIYICIYISHIYIYMCICISYIYINMYRSYLSYISYMIHMVCIYIHGTRTETTRRQTNKVGGIGGINNGAMKVNGCYCFGIVLLASVNLLRCIIVRSHGGYYGWKKSCTSWFMVYPLITPLFTMFHSYLAVANWCRIFYIHNIIYIIIPFNGGYFREWLHYRGIPITL